MTTPIFFADLDQTLIYSSRQLTRHGQTSVGNVVVEEYLGAPLSMTSLKALNLLTAYSLQMLRIIPVTTRTLAQFERIHFPYVDLSTFIVLNGARIFVDGVEVKSWAKQMRKEVYSQEVTPSQLFERVKQETKGFQGLKGVHKADGFFVYLVADTPGLPHIDNYVKEVAQDAGYVLSQQGRKSYFMPTMLTKGRALAALRERFTPALTFASGDSYLDLTMAPEVDHFILPSHGEAISAEASLRPGHVTQSRGIEVPGEIMDFITSVIKAHKDL